jgi:iron complex outermembrane receptor protein
VYGNYIEALEQGPTAPVTGSNPGQVFAPTRAKQLEAGVKAEIGALGLQAAVFEIERARGELDPISNRFGIIGQEKSRGAEFLAFGQPTSNLRVVGGVTFIDATFARTVDPTLQGRVVPGAAPRRLTASAFYSIPEVPGLSVNGRVTYASEQVVNTGNTQKIPAWTRMDVGASYRTAALGRPLVLRAALENVLNKNQWVATDGFGAVALGAPRTVLLSATMDF